MPIYPYSFQLPPLNVQDIPNDGAPGEFLGISAGGVLDWLPAGGGGSGDLLAANNLSELTNFATARTNIGLGTASTPTFANLTLTSPSLSSSAPVTISQTWNNAAVAFTGLKVNAVSTASADASLLLDLQLGGVTQVNSTKAGSLFARIFVSGNSQTSRAIEVAASGIAMGSLGVLAFAPASSYASNSDLFNVADTFLRRDGAANTLALRNGAVQQMFRVYGTYSDASNYRRLAMGSFNTTEFDIQTEGAGSGVTAGPLNFGTAGVRRMTITTAGNVGIGTTSPTSKLHVVGTIAAWKNATDYSAHLPAAGIFGYLNATGITTHLKFDDGSGNGTGAGLYLPNNGIVGWQSLARTDSGTLDTILQRDGEADHLAMRRSTNGQKFSVYGTYPGAAWERFTITAPTSGNVLLGTYKGTGGIARGLEFQTDGVTRMTIAAAGSIKITGTFNTLSLNIGATGTDSGFGDFSSNAIAVWANGVVGALIGRGGGFSGMRIGSDGMYRFSDTATPSSGVSAALALNAAGVVEVNNGTAAAFRDLRVRSVIEQPPASITPALNGDLVVEATSNTTLTFKLKGTDGTVRTGAITLA